MTETTPPEEYHVKVAVSERELAEHGTSEPSDELAQRYAERVENTIRGVTMWNTWKTEHGMVSHVEIIHYAPRNHDHDIVEAALERVQHELNTELRTGVEAGSN